MTGAIKFSLLSLSIEKQIVLKRLYSRKKDAKHLLFFIFSIVSNRLTHPLFIVYKHWI